MKDDGKVLHYPSMKIVKIKKHNCCKITTLEARISELSVERVIDYYDEGVTNTYN